MIGQCTSLTAPAAAPNIVVMPDAPAHVRFAARELQRYVYLRTGETPSISTTLSAPETPALIIAMRGDALANHAPLPASRPSEPDAAAFVLHAVPGAHAWILGANALGALHGTYRYIEHLGVRFHLHGDAVAETDAPFAWPRVEEVGRPMFAVRGLQPFHDFAEGPDWWNRDDALAVVGQMAKLRMNFIGLHTYPESSVGPEPTVWLGRAGEYEPDGRVRIAYPASYHTTARSGRQWWGYEPMKTSDFTGGAASLFDRDDFGGEVMRGHPFASQTPETAAEVFNRTADLLRDAFTEARQLGLQTCVGTETPLTIPSALKDRIIAEGRDPTDPRLAREIYTATFDRIRRSYPIDYYWLWTPETWTWEGNRPDQFAATAADIQAALDALEDLGKPFRLATCGWVLGPQHDRAALDKLLPPDSPMSAINQSVGHKPLELQFASLSERPRWAIPWLENDGALLQPQLWAGRMRYDAADARRLGCDGLLGIHWRTRVLAPNVAALAAAAWDQPWVPDTFDTTRLPPQTASGAVGGAARVMDASIDGVLATARVGMSAYEIPVPNGTYTITLHFPRASAGRPGERVFAVALDGSRVLPAVDLADQAHHEPHLVRGWKVGSGKLRVEFVPIAGEAAIAAIAIEGITEVNATPFARRINCGGPALSDHEADLLPGTARPDESRAMPVDAFYRDFATVEFGHEIGPEAGAILARMDGRLHQTLGWMDGPGGITRHREGWEELAPQYAFIDELEALRPRVRGAGNLARFESWLAQFRVYRAMAQIGCEAGAFDRAIEAAAAAETAPGKDQARQDLLSRRVALARSWERLMHLQIAATDTPGELGILANLEQHNRLQQRFLTRHDDALVTWLGAPLPPEASPSHEYAGADRVIVPTLRTSAHEGEALTVRVLLIGAHAPTGGDLLWRPMGRGDYQRVPLLPVARGVYQASLPALDAAMPALEYRIEAHFHNAPEVRWPASERGSGHTVVLRPTD